MIQSGEGKEVGTDERGERHLKIHRSVEMKCVLWNDALMVEKSFCVAKIGVAADTLTSGEDTMVRIPNRGVRHRPSFGI